MTRILIADDHAVVRSGIKEFLSGVAGFVVVAEAASVKETLAVVRSTPLDVVLLDIMLPDGYGLDVLKTIKLQQPDLHVLVFSIYSEEEFAIHALNAGASGYVSKSELHREIVEAIRIIARGGRYVSPLLAEKLISGATLSGAKLPHERLSRRESEVLLMLSKGIPLTRIGECLELSVKTVGTYRGRVLEKLNVRSNAELTRYVLEHKLG